MEKCWINPPVLVPGEILGGKKWGKVWKNCRKHFKNADNSDSYRPGADSEEDKK